MPLCVQSSAVVTRAVDLLTAAGIRVHHMQGPQCIDTDEYEATITELAGHQECREDNVVTFTDKRRRHGSLC